eukprot:6773090-Pyramimonas_sp.AAC.1
MISGVLQGCPLSGSLFAIAIDSFLWDVFRSVQRPGHGQIRACADDIGAVLSFRKGYRETARIFRNAGHLAGLTLKAEKCRVVPLSAALSDSLASDFRRLLRECTRA